MSCFLGEMSECSMTKEALYLKIGDEIHKIYINPEITKSIEVH
jgi:hypothetical protein